MGYWFPVFLAAINREEQIGDESRENLYHQAVLASGKKMRAIEVPVPPCKEFLNNPTELMYKRHLLRSQIKMVGGNPVGFIQQCPVRKLHTKKHKKSTLTGIFFDTQFSNRTLLIFNHISWE
jgi:hypothetical protein